MQAATNTVLQMHHVKNKEAELLPKSNEKSLCQTSNEKKNYYKVFQFSERLFLCSLLRFKIPIAQLPTMIRIFVNLKPMSV